MAFQTKFFVPMKRVVKVRFTEQMYSKVKESAENRGITISDFIRRAALSHPLIDRDPVLLDELVKLRNACKKNAGMYKHLLTTVPENQYETDKMLEQEINRSEMITVELENLLHRVRGKK